ncbi:MAG TPA: hemerythrin domain-containing protein [Pyrinomonadaceae bacterium]|nr:hemerythrin domain-containing protein [Pyrinomonadaceae bacterium]
MTAIEILKKDHRDALDLIGQIENIGDDAGAESRVKLFDDLKEALTLHTRAEEKIFYPELEDLSETRALIDESYKEHRKVSEILSRMDAIKTEQTSSQWKRLFNELKQNVEHHVQEEESILFPKAEKLLSHTELRDMFLEIERMKSHQSLNDSLIYPSHRTGSAD